MTKMIINCQASVVEYTFARKILYYCGYGVTRTSNSQLKIFDQCPSHNTLYVNEEENESFTTLIVDEGVFSDSLFNDGHLYISKGWWELVDFKELLRLVVNRIAPDFVPASCNAQGRSSRAIHFIGEYQYALLKYLPTSKLKNNILLTNIYSSVQKRFDEEQKVES